MTKPKNTVNTGNTEEATNTAIAPQPMPAQSTQSTNLTANFWDTLDEEVEEVDEAGWPATFILNKTETNYGFVISKKTAKKAGLDWDSVPVKLNPKDARGGIRVQHSFIRGQKEEIIIFQNPRLLVCKKAGLHTAISVLNGKYEKKIRLPYNDLFQKQNIAPEWRDKGKISFEQIYWLYFLDENNQPYHLAPFRYEAKRVAGISFAQAHTEYQDALQGCIKSASEKSGKKLAVGGNKRLKQTVLSRGVWELDLGVELRSPDSDPSKSTYCTIVADFKRPTVGGVMSGAEFLVTPTLEQAEALSLLAPEDALETFKTGSDDESSNNALLAGYSYLLPELQAELTELKLLASVKPVQEQKAIAPAVSQPTPDLNLDDYTLDPITGEMVLTVPVPASSAVVEAEVDKTDNKTDNLGIPF